jgi:hypothetical protein
MGDQPRMSDRRWVELEQMRATWLSTPIWEEIKAEMKRVRSVEVKLQREIVMLRYDLTHSLKRRLGYD